MPSASITFGARDVSASVRSCGMSPIPGPTSRQPIRSSLTSAVHLDDRRGQPFDGAATCSPGHSRRRFAPRPSRPARLRPASCRRAHGPAPRVFVHARLDRRQLGRRISCQRPAASMPMSASTTRPHFASPGYSRCAGFSAPNVTVMSNAGTGLAQRRCRFDAARKVASDADDRRMAQSRKLLINRSFQPRLRPVPNMHQSRSGAD